MSKNKIFTRYAKIILIGILTLGYFLRFQGIDFGLPFIYDEDESRRVNQAIEILVNRDPNPHWFGHPASTVIYLLTANYLGMFVVGKFLGIFNNFLDFQNLYFNQPSLFYWIGRSWIAAFGTGTILVTYYLGEKLENKRVGLVAAFLIAITPMHIKYSKIIRSDVLLTFFILLAFYYCLNILIFNRQKDYLLTGGFLGLAIVTKYPAIIFVPTIILAHFMSHKSLRKEIKKIGISAGSCLLAGFLAAPFLFIDINTAIRDITNEARTGNVGGNGEGLLINLVWYWQEALTNSLTSFGMFLLLIGIITTLVTREKKLLLLISFPLLFYLFISSLSLRWDRWIIPLLPFACLLIAWTLEYVAIFILVTYGGYAFRAEVRKQKAGVNILNLFNETRKAQKGQFFNKYSGNLWGFLIILIFSLGLMTISLMDKNQTEIVELVGLDTRTLTREWMLENLPRGSHILIDEGTPPLPLEFFELYQVQKEVLEKIDPKNYRHAFVGIDIQEMGKLKDLAEMQNNNIDYFLLSWKYLKYLEEKNRYPEVVATYTKIINRGNLIYELKRDQNKNITSGPTIQIYQLRKFNLYD